MAKQISDERKAAFYLGTGIMILGGIAFLSVFLTLGAKVGKFPNFQSDVQSSMYRGFGGMVLLIIGSFIRTIGARGLAGSGVILDPEQARSELEPYSRMAGGMAKDALEEADVKLGGGSSEKVVMVKCRACGKLNEEDSKFCQECGKEL